MKICPLCSELFEDEAGFCPTDGIELKKSTDRYLGRTIASRYRLVRRLGSGGMSVVYLARHVIIERLSAIKILRQDLGLNPSYRERFLREARAVNRINHRNIVEITDVGEADGVAYLVMEYVEGESLLATIQKGPLDWMRACRVAVQVASALARAHQMGVIHRDLKPDNILLVSASITSPSPVDEDAVKLTDFGIAKIVDAPALTFSEQLFGTPGYIAPEYVEGMPADARADIYSLGVVIYEMLAGTLPYDARGQADLLLKPLTSAPIPLSRRMSGLPPDLESLVLRMLARRPEDRPQDAFVVHDALVDTVRRFGSIPPPAARFTSAPPPREAYETIVDSTSAPPSRATANVSNLVTSEMGSRWSSALAELEASIGLARKKGGRYVNAAVRATDLAVNASEIVPRVERASRGVSELQGRVDRLEAQGREFRANLGNAIDVLVHDRSRERAHLEALRDRRHALQTGAVSGAASVSSPSPSPSPPTPSPLPVSDDARVWELAALEAEEARAYQVVEDLTFQLVTLQGQLDVKNEELDRELVEVTGALEGSMSAVRRLTNELVRTIDEGIAIVSAEKQS